MTPPPTWVPRSSKPLRGLPAWKTCNLAALLHEFELGIGDKTFQGGLRPLHGERGGIHAA